MDYVLYLALAAYLTVKALERLELNVPWIKPATRRRWLECRAARVQQEAGHLYERISDLRKQEESDKEKAKHSADTSDVKAA